MRLKFLGSFKTTFGGGVRPEAFSTNSSVRQPSPRGGVNDLAILRPAARRVNLPHLAAAPISIALAMAPAWRSRSHSDQVLVLPPVACMPKTVWL